MMSFGTLKYFGSIIKKLKTKSLFSINHMIYISVNVEPFSC